LIVLASGSARRAQILQNLAIEFEVKVSHVDETLDRDEDVEEAATRLARAKASAIGGPNEKRPVLAADTLVVCDGRILGKPSSPEDAAGMLRLLSGRDHEVVTAVCILNAGVLRSAVARTTVTFADLSEAAIEWYVRTREPLDKAGAYHVDGRGALFITGISGSPSNVAGLPVRTMLALAREAEIDLGLV
jgi:septum formation protein